MINTDAITSINQKEIDKAIDLLNQELGRKGIEQNVYLIIVGAASLILKFNLKRATADIDVLELISSDPRPLGGMGPLLSRMGFHIVSEAMLNLHPDYLDRLEKFTQKGLIHVFTLNPYDLAISKIGRGLDKDREDIVSSDIASQLNVDYLKELYFEAANYWIGNERTYEMNWDLFFEAFENSRLKIQ